MLAVAAPVALTVGFLAGLNDGVESVGYPARYLFGIRWTAAVVGSGVAVWAVLSLTGFLFGRPWVTRTAAFALVLALPLMYSSWEAAYWRQHPWVAAPVAMPSQDQALRGRTLRGTLMGECGYFTAFEVTFDTDSTATGTLLPLYASQWASLVVALGELDTPSSRPLQAAVEGGSLRLRSDGWGGL